MCREGVIAGCMECKVKCVFLSPRNVISAIYSASKQQAVHFIQCCSNMFECTHVKMRFA